MADKWDKEFRTLTDQYLQGLMLRSEYFGEIMRIAHGMRLEALAAEEVSQFFTHQDR